eukprot:TRINITY_DN4458_c0_g1_i10.p1 TRINITY_DN4458_c0_g1~~TRINITY_DN4458_c0_g1_i10.p1  ORF type:complete len:269 (-),score=39.16 TRINITY_DN4458_c0_g1_i10:259-1065(-)
MIRFFFFFQAEDGIRDRSPSRGLGDVYKRQVHGDFTLNHRGSNQNKILMTTSHLLLLLILIQGTISSKIWQGKYVLTNGCIQKECCCPVVGHEFHIYEYEGITFTYPVQGAKCKGKTHNTLAARFNTERAEFSGRIGSYGGKGFYGMILRTMTDLQVINQENPSCNFVANSMEVRAEVPKDDWSDNYVYDGGCDKSVCCCPSGEITVNNPASRQLNVYGAGQGRCDSFIYHFRGEFLGQTNYEAEVTDFKDDSKWKARLMKSQQWNPC